MLRIRLTDPEQEAKRLFDFLGEESVPGITETIFSRKQQRSGPGDHKIWQTSKIGTDSVGRGWNIPARLLPPPLLAEINALADRLGYLPVGPDWGTGDRPGDIPYDLERDDPGTEEPSETRSSKGSTWRSGPFRGR